MPNKEWLFHVRSDICCAAAHPSWEGPNEVRPGDSPEIRDLPEFQISIISDDRRTNRCLPFLVDLQPDAWIHATYRIIPFVHPFTLNEWGYRVVQKNSCQFEFGAIPSCLAVQPATSIQPISEKSSSHSQNLAVFYLLNSVCDSYTQQRKFFFRGLRESRLLTVYGRRHEFHATSRR